MGQGEGEGEGTEGTRDNPLVPPSLCKSHAKAKTMPKSLAQSLQAPKFLNHFAGLGRRNEFYSVLLPTVAKEPLGGFEYRAG
jgi:hypothetical protein